MMLFRPCREMERRKELEERARKREVEEKLAKLARIEEDQRRRIAWEREMRERRKKRCDLL